MTSDLDRLRYPIGQFEAPSHIDENHLQSWIAAPALGGSFAFFGP